MSITDKELEKISTSKGLEGTLYSHSLVVSMAKELLAYRKAEQEGLLRSPNWDNIPSGVVSRRLASELWEYIAADGQSTLETVEIWAGKEDRPE